MSDGAAPLTKAYAMRLQRKIRIRISAEAGRMRVAGLWNFRWHRGHVFQPGRGRCHAWNVLPYVRGDHPDRWHTFPDVVGRTNYGAWDR